MIDWKRLWGSQPYREHYGIPSLWRSLHDVGRPLGEAVTDELPTLYGSIQYFQGGYITWGGPNHGPHYYTERALVRGPQLPDDFSIPSPSGIEPHLTNTEVAVDASGVVFVRTQASATYREEVWRIVNGQPELLSIPGPSVAFGNGSFFQYNGYLYLLMVSSERKLRSFRIKEWVPYEV